MYIKFTISLMYLEYVIRTSYIIYMYISRVRSYNLSLQYIAM